MTSFTIRMLLPHGFDLMCMLYIGGCPTIAKHPEDKKVAVGKRVEFECQATGAAPLTHSWLYNGVDIPDKHGRKLAFIVRKRGLHGPGHYTCRVENEFGSKESDSAKLTVGQYLSSLLVS